jgi:pyruvate/2-oxoglutarate dehydrogenase complex dihydrolipoamide dehydrogenase (E3) component
MNSQANPDYNAHWRRMVFPDNHINPKPKPRYHLCVIGAGPAGLVTSIAAAGLGAKVALVERHAMGGDCLNVGCVPSKALLEFTRSNHGPENFQAAFEWLRKVRAGIAEHDSVERYSRAGVDVFLGTAAFRDARTLQVDGLDISARRYVIATGARAGLPPIPGLADSAALTNETVFELQRQPQRLAIIGAGPIGCELALVFARLGTQVDLIEIAPRIMQSEHEEASTLVARSLEHAGVRIHPGAKIHSVARERDGMAKIVLGNSELDADQLLVAAGRRANTENLNLEAAGVELTKHGLIAVDDKLRTTNSRIFAAGDVCSQLQFTHHADAHARIVVQNALFLPSGSTRKLVVPHCTYTKPEVAQVGKLARDLVGEGIAFDAWRVTFAELDRGRAEGDEDGFAEVLTEKGKGRILGATVVAHDAGEQIAPLCLAMNNRISLGRLSATVLPYPTRAEYIRRLSDQFNRTRLTPTVSRIMQQWFRWTA